MAGVWACGGMAGGAMRVVSWRDRGRGYVLNSSYQFFFIYFAQEGGTLLVYLIYFFLQKINQNSGSVALPFGLVIT